MKIDGALNVWGKGQLIAYSGIDGETDYDDGLVLRSREEGGFDLCLPEPGRILLPGGAPRRCFLASDCFELDGIRGVLPECRHLLIEGDGCSADVPAGKLAVLRRGNRLLVGVAVHFRPELIDGFRRCRPAPASDAGQGVFTAEGAGQLRLRRDSVPVDDAGPLAASQDVALGLGLSRGRTAPFRSGDGAGEPARRAVAAVSGRPDSAYDVAARPFGGDPAAGAGLRHRGGR